MKAHGWLFWFCWLLSFGGGPETKAIQPSSEECLDCHEDVAEALAWTLHARDMDIQCVDCHGYSQAHVDDPDSGAIDTGQGPTGMQYCLSCHASSMHQKRPGKSMHASTDLYCAGCHQVHPSKSPPRPALLVSPQSTLCLTCHQDVRGQLAKPYNHKLHTGIMNCSSCHDPHGGRGAKSFKHQNLEATCTSCHPETRGPFVFSHVNGFVGDCMTCHEAHGSSNPRQLTRSRIDQLCLECHSTLPAGTLGSQPPSTHNLRSPRYRNCTVCHTAVHGSSRSPALLE